MRGLPFINFSDCVVDKLKRLFLLDCGYPFLNRRLICALHLIELQLRSVGPARGLLDWTQQELADAAHVEVATVGLFEAEASDTRHATLEVLDGRSSWPASSSLTKTVAAWAYGYASVCDRSPPNNVTGVWATKQTQFSWHSVWNSARRSQFEPRNSITASTWADRYLD